jgi:hypothetical protein
MPPPFCESAGGLSTHATHGLKNKKTVLTQINKSAEFVKSGQGYGNEQIKKSPPILGWQG